MSKEYARLCAAKCGFLLGVTWGSIDCNVTAATFPNHCSGLGSEDGGVAGGVGGVTALLFIFHKLEPESKPSSCWGLLRHSGFGVEGLLWVSDADFFDILARNASLPVIGPCFETLSKKKYIIYYLLIFFLHNIRHATYLIILIL